MSLRHRRKRSQHKEKLVAQYLGRLEEKLLDAARQKLGADFTPEMEAFLRAELRK